MNDGYVKTDPWRLVEDRFDPSRALSSESLFALGNGVMGGRANFEERYSGETLQGNYIGGVYYPDKTRVGWWKNGYPEYFAKVPNAAFWIGVDVAVDGEPLDLATVAEVKSFYRETDMRRSVLTRRMRVVLKNGVEVAVETVRFLSLARRELGVVKYAVTPLGPDHLLALCRRRRAQCRRQLRRKVLGGSLDRGRRHAEPYQKERFRGGLGAGRRAGRRRVALRNPPREGPGHRSGQP